MKSKERGERLGEEQFVVDVIKEDVFQKVCRYPLYQMGANAGSQRRKSMEPRALTLVSSMGPGSVSGVTLDCQSAMLSPGRSKFMGIRCC